MPAKVVSVVMQKGGVGKSTITFNLGYNLSRSHRVLLLDTDGQYQLTKLAAAERTAEATLAKAYELPDSDLRDFIQPTKFREEGSGPFPRLGIVPSEWNVNDVDSAVLTWRHTRLDPQRTLDKLLKRSREVLEWYDVVLVDTPPALNNLTANSLMASDYVLLPIQMSDDFSVDNLMHPLALIGEVVKETGGRLKPLGFIQNMHDHRLLITRAVRADLERYSEETGIPILEPAIPDSTVVQQANKLKEPIAAYDHRSAPGRALSQLTQLIAREIGLDGGARGN